MSSFMQSDISDNKNKLSKTYTVRYSETGANGRITCPNILNYFQDIATFHAGKLGISALDLIQKNFAWVIYKLNLRVYDYPAWDTDLHLTTWRYPDKKLYELRSFEAKNEEGRILFSGKCAWVMIHLDTKKPVRLNRYLPEKLFTNPIKINNDFTLIDPPEQLDITKNLKVCMHHLDFNRHVNNTIYLQWAIENVPLKIQASFLPSDVDIIFCGDAVLDDDLQCSSQYVDFAPEPVFVHQIFHLQNNTELTRIKTQWKKFDYSPI
ncbi:acyl-ACP thioesterase [Candidatus Magnetomorum sp. HK-1]|nr:acyl-ACP thioesterase [Candidatus Magnetomorum sp. HK-1]